MHKTRTQRTAVRVAATLGSAAVVLTGLAAPAQAAPETCKTTLKAGAMLGSPWVVGEGNIIGYTLEPHTVQVGAYYPYHESPLVEANTRILITSKKGLPVVPTGAPKVVLAYEGYVTAQYALEWTKQFTKCMERREG